MGNYDINAIKARTNIATVLQAYGKDAPHRDKLMRSPFREESTPSFSVYSQMTMWKDHVTGHGGDCIDLIMELTGCNKRDAISRAAELAGISEVADSLYTPTAPPSRTKKRDEEETPYCLTKKQLDALNRSLILSDHRVLWSMYCKRKEAWDESTLKNLIERGQIASTPKGHLAFLAEKKGNWFCKTRSDAATSRSCKFVAGKASRFLFGNFLALGNGPIVIVEGESDTITGLSLGLTDAQDEIVDFMGVLGCNTIPDFSLLFSELSHRKVVVLFDHDAIHPKTQKRAGYAAAVKLTEHIRKVVPTATVVNLTNSLYLEGEDLTDFVMRVGQEKAREEFRKLLDS